MSLKPEVSITTGLAVGALVWSVYGRATPPVTDIRVGPQGDKDLDAARKMAAWTSAGAVAAISLIAKDPTIFIIGGGMVVIVDWWTRHANQVNPLAGFVSMAGDDQNTALQDVTPDPVFMSGAA